VIGGASKRENWSDTRSSCRDSRADATARQDA
jgi:hypothetical protein